MKELTQKVITMYKRPSVKVDNIDYTMNTCYYRTVLNGETLCSSVDPRLACHATTGYAGSQVFRVEL